jgi:hypothetical protein
MYFSTVVRVLAAGSGRGIAGAKVSLFDRDAFTPDDLLGTGTTDGSGEVRFDYTSEKFVDIDDHLGGVFPELYAVVYDAEGRVVVSTKDDTVDNTPRKFITVAVPADLVGRLEGGAES